MDYCPHCLIISDNEKIDPSISTMVSVSVLTICRRDGT